MNTQLWHQLTRQERYLLTKIVNDEMEIDDDTDFYDKLYEHYLNSGEMPYGVAKARTGDPGTWILDQLCYDFELLIA